MKAFWSRVCAAIASVAGVLSLSSQDVVADDTGLLGSNLTAVEKTSDLFLFFNFASIGKETNPDGTVVTSYKPTGDAFRALVTLRVTTDNQGTIKLMKLSVARSFIDDRKQCIYAATWSKAFSARPSRLPRGNPSICWPRRSAHEAWRG